MSPDRSGARRALLRRLLQQEPIVSQDELRARLATHGHRVAQTTISRDLTAIGAQKSDVNGVPRYAVMAAHASAPTDLHQVAERMRLFVVSIEASANLVVIKTPPGSAHSVAVALDETAPGTIPELLGTIAGDDTMFVAARPPFDGAALSARLRSIMESHP
jgi:transcriptional regulator of arginine metabolism